MSLKRTSTCQLTVERLEDRCLLSAGALDTTFNPTGSPPGTVVTPLGGGHADIVMPAVTGSQATGQASGAAGLVISYARQKGVQLQPNEVKQGSPLLISVELSGPASEVNGT